jgi:hypothetical protein
VEFVWDTYEASRGVPLTRIPLYLLRCVRIGSYMLFVSGCSRILAAFLWLLPLLGLIATLERVLSEGRMQRVGYDMALMAWFYAVRWLAEVIYRIVCIAIDRVRGVVALGGSWEGYVGEVHG